MKRVIAVLLLLCLLVSMAACGGSTEDPTPTDPTAAPTTPTTAATDPTDPATEPTEPTIPAPTAPSVDLTGQTAIVNTEGMTELQKAVVITAESFFMRGGYAQYDQYSMTNGNAEEVDRRTYGIMAPEDYTAQFTSYTDCSGFVYDVYQTALKMTISSSFPFTKTLTESSAYRVLREQPVKDNFAEMTTEQLAQKEKEFRETLQPGDIIVYRNAKNTAGHAMLYVGNGMKIHSTGTSYDFANAEDKGRESGTYRYDSIEGFFTPGTSAYLFEKSVYVILRPLDKFKREIPEATQQRMGVMRGIMAEKLCSHTYGQTVNAGGTMTFTFRLKNNSNITKPLLISDTVPEYTTYLSGAETVIGKNLYWVVTVPAGETVEVSYTVKVDENAAAGTYIQSQSTVSGIAVKCPRVMVGKTLNETQQQAIITAFESLKGSAQGIDLVNAIYEAVCGKAAFAHKDTAAIWSDVLTVYTSVGTYFLGTEPLAPMVAPRLYGGTSVSERSTAPALIQYRTRLVTNQVMVVGDIVLADNTLYLFTGEGLQNLTNPDETALKKPESLLAAKKFVVLRPSMVL